MITEDYVSFETAKLLKDKGFKHWCYKCYGDAVYHKGVPISFDEECELKSEGLEDEIEYVEGGHLYDFGCDNRKEEANVWAAPTLWVAMKWLREEKKISTEVNIIFDLDDDNKWYYEYGFCIFQLSGTFEKLAECDYDGYKTYEEACEAAIRYTLENLI